MARSVRDEKWIRLDKNTRALFCDTSICKTYGCVSWKIVAIFIIYVLVNMIDETFLAHGILVRVNLLLFWHYHRFSI